MKKSLRDLAVAGKHVLVRVDFNVPMSNGKITSNVRIEKEIPTIQYLLAQNAKVILCSHLGRPDGKPNMEYSLRPVFEELKRLLPNRKIYFCPVPFGEQANKMAGELENGEILLLENLRFSPLEEQNSDVMARELASLCDFFVFDAFGTSHRSHASTVGVSKYVPSAMGFLVEKEIVTFEQIMKNPERPFVAVLGGAKVADKIDVVKNLLDKVDVLLIGGGMCFSFIKAIKGKIGTSIVDDSKLDFCYQVIKKALNKQVEIVLPVDFICAKNVDDIVGTKCYMLDEFPEDKMGLDIGPRTVSLFAEKIKNAKTIVWNGPMGVFERELYSGGTKSVAELIAKNKKCVSVAGGGDVVSAIQKYGFEKKFFHISTGGGASLKLLEGGHLPAIDALSDGE